MKVFVYFNLHKKCWSVKDLKTGRVVRHAKNVLLTDVTFKVSEAGRQRVIREKRKNVHAGVVGIFQACWDEVNKDHADERHAVTYNPYKGPHFHYKHGGLDVFEAPMAVLRSDRLVYV